MVSSLDEALDEVLRRIAAHHRAASELVLRGSRLTRLLVAPRPRDCEDLDFLAMVPWSEAYLLGLLDEAIGDRIDHEVIFEHTSSPGVRSRHAIAGQVVQVDVGVGDPIVPEPVWCEVTPGARLRCVRAETMVAWKLHGLYEFHDRAWRLRHDEEIDPLALEVALLEGAPRISDLLDDRAVEPWLSALQQALSALEDRVARQRLRGRAAIGADATLPPPFRRMVFRSLEGRADAVESTLLELLGRQGGYEEALGLLGPLPALPRRSGDRIR